MSRGPKRRALPQRDEVERDKLVVQYLPLVLHVIRKLRMTNPLVRKLDMDDAEQTGRMALMKAATYWVEARGVKFITYAYRAIWTEVTREARQGTLVHIPEHCFLPSRTVNGIDPNAQRALDGYKWIDQFQNADRLTWLGRESSDTRRADQRMDLELLLRGLPHRHRQVLTMMESGRYTMREAGKLLGMSCERVRQIRDRAIYFVLRGIRLRRERLAGG